MNARDHEARTSEITDCDPIDEITLNQARLMVCANSDNAAEAELVMRMLGIHPDKDDDESYATKVPNLPTAPRILRTAPPPPGATFRKNRLHNDSKGGRV